MASDSNRRGFNLKAHESGLRSRSMQSERQERRRQPGRGRRGESGHRGAAARSPQEEEVSRLRDIITVVQQKEKKAGDGDGQGAGREEEEKRGRGRDRGSGRRAASEGGEWSEEARRLRWAVSQLDKEKLELTSRHNQELCRLQAELTRLRSSVERGEAQRAELQYHLTMSQRDAAVLSRNKHTLTERAAELQQTVQELQRVLDMTRQAGEEDQHALQQQVEERDKLIQRFSSENQRLQRLLQEQQGALEESERRLAEVEKQRQQEAEVTRQQAEELKCAMEREERRRREKEVFDQRVRSLESSIESERASHLESKFNSEIIQLRVRDLEAALSAERSSQQEAQSSLELLRTQFREVERAYSLERERSGSTERALERVEAEYDQCKSDLTVALEMERKTTFDLSERLEEEKKQHDATRSKLQQALKTQCDAEDFHVNFLQQIIETLQHHSVTGCSAQAVHDGKQSSSAAALQLLNATLSASQQQQKETEKQVQDLLITSGRLQEENETLRQLTTDQSRQIDDSRETMVKLEEEVTCLRQQGSDWSVKCCSLQEALQREMEERTSEVQRRTSDHQEESKAHLSFLYCLYQRLVAGCVLLSQPHCILGDFSWEELCDVISEQVDQLTSDLQKAKDKISHLQAVCEKKRVCVRELQRHQQRALTRLKERVRRREEAWSNQQSQLHNELQVCRSQRDALRDHVSSLDLHIASLTSDLSRLRGVASRSHRESASFLSACALLAGTLKHTQCRLQTLCEQKSLLVRRLAEREVLEQEVRRLAAALGGEVDEEEEERGRRAVRRWRRGVCAVLALRRWSTLAKNSDVLFRLERGCGLAVCVCGESTTATEKGQSRLQSAGPEGVCIPSFHSKHLSSTILSSMADLQGALAHTGSNPPDVMPAACSGLSRLLDHILDQSDLASSRAAEETLSGRLRLGLKRLVPSQPSSKAVVSTVQQHFLLFSQRLHSAEVERRSLRQQVANLKRGLQQERDTCRPVLDERFHSVCAELRQALDREQEAQSLIQELQLRVKVQSSAQIEEDFM